VSLEQRLRAEAALRRVAMLAADVEAPLAAVHEAVTAEASDLLAPAEVRIARADNPADLDTAIAWIAKEYGTDLGAAIAVPIVVGGTTWGALVAAAAPPGPQLESEALLGEFSQITASAVAARLAREELRGLADQRAALLRLAMLAARGSKPKSLLGVIAVEASQLLGVDAVSLIRHNEQTSTFTRIAFTHAPRVALPDRTEWPVDDAPLGSLIMRTGQPARIDDLTALPWMTTASHRNLGFGQAIGAPIVIGGAIWGYIGAYTEAGETFPPGCEARLAEFTQLMAIAIANVQARDELRGLAESHGALRRVAALVAQGAEPTAVFTAVAEESARMLGLAAVSLISYDAQSQTFTKILGTHVDRSAVPVGRARPVADYPEGALVLETGLPARIDDWSTVPGKTAARHRAYGFGQAIGVPILIGGAIWGYIGAYAEADEILPAESEARLAELTQLMATAIANAQARDELRGLAEWQVALHRVATLVAQGAEPQAVFTAVAVETARIIGVGAVSLIRYDAEKGLLKKIFGTHGERSAVPDGGQWTLDDGPEAATIVRTLRPVRIDDWSFLPGPVAARHREQGFGQCVAAPIIVNGTLWGLISAFGEADEILPPGSETRLADFTNLMASAIANAQARDELRGLAEQQGAALRRVATLVAKQAPLGTIFDAVAGEASRALRVERVEVGRCDDDGNMTPLGSAGRPGDADQHAFPATGRIVAAKVMQTGRAARIDDWTSLPAADAAAASAEGVTSVVGAPIIVDGAPWGVIVVLAGETLREDTETRLTDFTHLVASSISNVHARNSLIASRARIVTASDETQRRIERNLHDGIQQRVVNLGLGLNAVRARFRLPPEVEAGLDEVAGALEDVLEEIRVFSRGLHPALLSRAGIGPSLRELARRSAIPVTLAISASSRFPEPIETAVYYVVSEALANAAKHSQASEVTVTVAADGAAIRATIADDGVGGASLGRSSGLIGLVDRVEALGGRFTLDSPAGRGTAVSIELPLSSTAIDEPPVL
jgi:signal transduction histidine kinase